MENFELFNNGLIDEVGEHDYMFGTDNIVIKENTNKDKYGYNQALQSRTKNGCVLYANCGVVSDLTGYKFSEAELLEIVDLAEKSYGWHESMGMSFVKGTDCVRTWWNKKFPDNQLITFRLDIGSEKFYEALDKGHSLTVGYKTSRDYLIDSQDDGEIQGEDFKKNGGHLVRLYKKGDNLRIIDNYDGKKIYNDYINNKIEKLQKNGVYYISVYLYLFNNDYMNQQIKENIDLEGAKIMFEKGFWNGLNAREPMSRQEVMQVLYKILNKD